MKKESHSGIYLLPNILTTASLFAAFYAIVAAMKGYFESAVIAIFIGMVADGLDGRIARLTKTQSAFGAQYDSLSDMVTFGVATSLLLYSAYLQQLGKIGWLVAFVYTASVALRLARFNIQLEVADKRYFSGLACPAGAALIASFVWVAHQNLSACHEIAILSAVVSLMVSMLMVSNIQYYSFKEIDFHGKVPFLYILLIVIIFVAIAASPSWIIFIVSLAYALSGPIQAMVKWKISRQAKKTKEK